MLIESHEFTLQPDINLEGSNISQYYKIINLNTSKSDLFEVYNFIKQFKSL